MAKKKAQNQEPFNGEVTPKMISLWTMASLSNGAEIRQKIATLQFYLKSGVNDGLRVRNTQALAVTKEIAEMYFGSEN